MTEQRLGPHPRKARADQRADADQRDRPHPGRQAALDHPGTVVALAYDGRETLDLAAELQPDAVVIDLHMPNVHGLTAIRQLREAHPQICLIVLTGDESAAIREHALAANDGFLDESGRRQVSANPAGVDKAVRAARNRGPAGVGVVLARTRDRQLN